jgi:hypothetical protein
LPDHGFRYVEVTGYPNLAKEDIEQLHFRTANKLITNFTSSSAVFYSKGEGGRGGGALWLLLRSTNKCRSCAARTRLSTLSTTAPTWARAAT